MADNDDTSDITEMAPTFNAPVPPGTAPSHQQNLRVAILAIQADTSLDPAEKARRMQALMSSQHRVNVNPKTMLSAADDLLSVAMDNVSFASGQNEASASFVDAKNESGETVRVAENAVTKSYHGDDDDEELGCKHYMRGLKVQPTCCDKWYVCRLCHDSENSDHNMNRHATNTIICMHCQTIQSPSQQCCSCNETLGVYYCDICRLWDNDEDKSIYHCDKCGICRVGKGLGQDYFHCDKCNVCLAMSLQDNHRCIERNLESNCPICHEFMQTSTQPVIFMPCSHGIHWLCYQEHIKMSYQCPICWKSLVDMSHYFRQIDQMLAHHKMPTEYENFWSTILCNDCEEKTRTKYHFLYHKCQKCGGYNTKVLSTEEERATNNVGQGGDEGGGDLLLVQQQQQPQQSGEGRVRSSSAVSNDSRHHAMQPDDNENNNRRDFF